MNSEELKTIKRVALITEMIRKTDNGAFTWKQITYTQYTCFNAPYDFYVTKTNAETYALDVWKNAVFYRSYNSSTQPEVKELYDVVDSRLAGEAPLSRLRRLGSVIGRLQPPNTYDETTSGGVNLGGRATMTYDEVATGGAVGGGRIINQYVGVTSGGAVAGGLAVNSQTVLMQGGAVLSGQADVDRNFVMLGGVLAGGTAVNQWAGSAAASGGAVAGGAAIDQISTFNEVTLYPFSLFQTYNTPPYQHISGDIADIQQRADDPGVETDYMEELGGVGAPSPYEFNFDTSSIPRTDTVYYRCMVLVGKSDPADNKSFQMNMAFFTAYIGGTLLENSGFTVNLSTMTDQLLIDSADYNLLSTDWIAVPPVAVPEASYYFGNTIHHWHVKLNIAGFSANIFRIYAMHMDVRYLT